MTTKLCSNCGGRAGFHKNRSRKDGRQTHCKDCVKKYQKKYRLTRRGKIASALASRRHRLKRYGISLDEFSRMLLKQKSKCQICGRDISQIANVDHSHTTGKVRGLLCNACNTALGLVNEDTRVLSSAIKYLKKHRQ